MIKEFLEDTNETEAFITGSAGTGKTTLLFNIVEELVKQKVNFKVVAYTHKAKDVLLSKLPKLEDDYIFTLHAFLKKRPTVNSKATDVNKLLTSKQYGEPEPLELLIIDEFSFVGEKDYMSLGDLQDEYIMARATVSKCPSCTLKDIDVIDVSDTTYTFVCEACDHKWTTKRTARPLKVLYVGDLNQLNPVKDVQAVVPHEPYWVKLTKIHRQGDDSDLHVPLQQLVDMIQGETDIHYLEPTNDFKRDVPLDTLYEADDTESKIMLAFTNKAVQTHNARLQGRSQPISGDRVYIPTLRREATIVSVSTSVPADGKLVVPVQPYTIDFSTKFNPLKTISELKYTYDIRYYTLDTGEVIPAIFGVHTNKVHRDILAENLTTLNRQGKNSKLAFKRYKVVSDYVSIMDFTHCMTIHKSQGSEYDHVYVDYIDLAENCISIKDVIRLLYVALSRAKFKVFMS